MINFNEIADLLNTPKYEVLFMNCKCGSDRFARAGLQEMLLSRLEEIPLVNCLNCHTTVSATREFYDSLPEHIVSDDGCFVNQKGEQDV